MSLTGVHLRSASSFISLMLCSPAICYVVGAEEFADYRAQLLPWSECEPRLRGLLRSSRHSRARRGFCRRLEGRTDEPCCRG